MAAKDKVIYTRLRPELFDKVSKLATEEQRSIAAQIAVLVQYGFAFLGKPMPGPVRNK